MKKYYNDNLDGTISQVFDASLPELREKKSYIVSRRALVAGGNGGGVVTAPPAEPKLSTTATRERQVMERWAKQPYGDDCPLDSFPEDIRRALKRIQKSTRVICAGSHRLSDLQKACIGDRIKKRTVRVIHRIYEGGDDSESDSHSEDASESESE